MTVTDTITLYGVACTSDAVTPGVTFTRNQAAPLPVPDCRPADGGVITIVVADPADHRRVYDRVVLGPGGYASAVAPVGLPFVLILEDDESPDNDVPAATPASLLNATPAAPETSGPGIADRSRVSPIYRLSADRDRRQPITVRVIVVGPATPAATPAATPTGATGGGGEATAERVPVRVQGLVCEADSRAGTYAYLPGTLPEATADEACRAATAGEMEFLLVDETDPGRLYDDALSGPDGSALLRAPAGRRVTVSEFDDDPAADSGLTGGSAPFVAPEPAAGAPTPISMTVVRYVAAGSSALAPGTVFVSSVACDPATGTTGIGVLGPAPTILVSPDGPRAGTPVPMDAGADDTGDGADITGCVEAAASYQVWAPGGGDTPLVTITDGADDGATLFRLAATLTADGTRVFPPYRLTEDATGLSAELDVREGAFTSVRVVLPRETGTPAATDAASAPGTPDPSTDPAAATPAIASDTASPVAGSGPGAGLTGFRLLWGALAALAIAVFLAGAWVLRRPARRDRSPAAAPASRRASTTGQVRASGAVNGRGDGTDGGRTAG